MPLCGRGEAKSRGEGEGQQQLVAAGNNSDSIV